MTGVSFNVVCSAEDSASQACNDVGKSTLSAASDPIVASTLADPPYITEVVVTEDVELTMFLDEVLVSDLVAGHDYWFSVPLVLRQVSH